MRDETTVFFDLDGVVADFVTAAFAHHGVSMPMREVKWDFDKQLGIDPKAFWASLGREFWAGLPIHGDGMALFRHAEALVGKERLFLLSSPCLTDGCLEGKRDWVREHLPEYERHLFLGSRKHAFAGPMKLLVDDHDANLDAWYAAGGRGFRVPRPWNNGRDKTNDRGGFDTLEVMNRLEAAVDGYAY